MTTTTLHETLVAATGAKRQKRQTLQTYYRDLMLGVKKLTDEEWDALGPEAQDWANAAAKELRKSQRENRAPEIAVMPEHEVVEEPEAPEPVASEETPSAPKKARKPQKRSGASGAEAIRSLLLEHPTSTVPQLMELLQERGMTPTKSSVQTVHHHVKATIRSLFESGMVTDAAAFETFAKTMSGKKD